LHDPQIGERAARHLLHDAALLVLEAALTASLSARKTAAFARLCRARSGAIATTSPCTSS
jgi:hypothetical protein